MGATRSDPGWICFFCGFIDVTRQEKMKKRVLISILLAVGLVIGSGVSAQELRREILGVRLAMTKEEAHKRLRVIGKFVRDERKQQEIWQVRHESFSHLIVGFDKKQKMRFVTAVAREDNETKRVAYDQVGILEKARQAGDPEIKVFAYEWELPAEKGEPVTLLIARGRDPKFLSTLSLKRMGDGPAPTAPE